MGVPPPHAAGFDDAIVATLSSASLMATSLPSLASSVGLEIPSATTALAVALASATAIADVGSAKGPHHGAPKNGECQLLGPFALIVQAALGGMALLALVFKRWRERPQRPLKIWGFDVSKQVVGSVLVHIANLLMSMLSSGQFSIKVDTSTVSQVVAFRRDDSNGHYQPNPCSFYLLNLAIDTTLGIPILILFLRIFTGLLLLTPFGKPTESIQSGHYGNPPKAKWWAKQSLIYFLGLMCMKLCVLLIFVTLPWISRIGDWALRWTEGNEQLQVFFVMLFFPVVMNAAQYYIIDSFIKNQKPDSSDSHPGAEAGTYDAVGDEDDYDDATMLSESIHSEDEGDRNPEGPHVASKIATKTRTSMQYDGESSPTVVGSGSTERGKLLERDAAEESEGDRKPRAAEK